LRRLRYPGSHSGSCVPGGGGKWEVFVHEPTCGNGVVDPAEECGDGNVVSG